MPAYYVLATTEASTNLARYCGMRFGVPEKDYHQHFNDFFSGVRSEQLRGRGQKTHPARYFLPHGRVQEQVLPQGARGQGPGDRRNTRRSWPTTALIVSPTMPFLPPRFDEISKMRPLEMYQADFLTIPPNLTGLPHISLPCGYETASARGMQLVAPHWEEGSLIGTAEVWERHFQYHFPEVSL